MIQQTMDFISQYDPEVGASIREEYGRERRNIELIASENIVSEAVITLIILADRITEGAMKEVSKIKRYKNYRLTLEGWSHYRLVALELSSGRAAYNRQGQSLKKLVSNII